MEPRQPRPLTAPVTVGRPGARNPGAREIRNGMPDVLPYAWRGRRQPWAQRAVRQAIAEHGEPVLRRRRGGGYTWDD